MGVISDCTDDPLVLVSKGGSPSLELACGDTLIVGERTGGRGSGLFKSESVLLRDIGEDVGWVAEKSENETICGVREVTGLP